MKKSKRIDLRATPEEIILLDQQAKENGMNRSEYIFSLVKKDSRQNSHELQIKNSLIENGLFNSLLLNPSLSNKAKQIIGKEMRKYV